jgi:hypothetical protein
MASLVPFHGGQWLTLSLQKVGGSASHQLANFHMQECDPEHVNCVDREEHGDRHRASALAVANAKEGILDFIDKHGCLESPTKGRGYGFDVSMMAIGQGLFRHVSDCDFSDVVNQYDISLTPSREYMFSV